MVAASVVTSVVLGISVISLGRLLWATLNSLRDKNIMIEELQVGSLSLGDELCETLRELADSKQKVHQFQLKLRNANQRDAKGRMLPVGINPDGSKV